MLDGLCNGPWLPITDADRVHLADIFNRAFAEARAFVAAIEHRPLQKLIANGKAQAS
jgi:hypothetical protein